MIRLFKDKKVFGLCQYQYFYKTYRIARIRDDTVEVVEDDHWQYKAHLRASTIRRCWREIDNSDLKLLAKAK